MIKVKFWCPYCLERVGAVGLEPELENKIKCEVCNHHFDISTEIPERLVENIKQDMFNELTRDYCVFDRFGYKLKEEWVGKIVRQGDLSLLYWLSRAGIAIFELRKMWPVTEYKMPRPFYFMTYLFQAKPVPETNGYKTAAQVAMKAYCVWVARCESEAEFIERALLGYDLNDLKFERFREHQKEVKRNKSTGG